MQIAANYEDLKRVLGKTYTQADLNAGLVLIGTPDGGYLIPYSERYTGTPAPSLAFILGELAYNWPYPQSNRHTILVNNPSALQALQRVGADWDATSGNFAAVYSKLAKAGIDVNGPIPVGVYGETTGGTGITSVTNDAGETWTPTTPGETVPEGFLGPGYGGTGTTATAPIPAPTAPATPPPAEGAEAGISCAALGPPWKVVTVNGQAYCYNPDTGQYRTPAGETVNPNMVPVTGPVGGPGAPGGPSTTVTDGGPDFSNVESGSDSGAFPKEDVYGKKGIPAPVLLGGAVLAFLLLGRRR